MADQQAAVAPAGQDGQGQPRQQSGMLGMVIRAGVMYFLMSYLRGGQKKSPVADSREVLRPLFEPGHLMDLDVYLSQAPDRYGKPLWHHGNIPLSDASVKLLHTVTLDTADLAPAIDHNRTLYLVTRWSDASAELPEAGPNRAMRVPRKAFCKSMPLIVHHAPPKRKAGKSLLGAADGDDAGLAAPPGKQSNAPSTSTGLDATVGDEDGDEDAQPTGPWLAHFKPNLTISMVNEFTAHAPSKLPPAFAEQADISMDMSAYYPVIHISEFWLLRDYLVPLNETVTSVDLHLEVDTISNMWWQFQAAIKQSFDMQKNNGLMGEKEVDELKRIFLEGNPYLLALTMCVSLLHSVFDALAFKNDIGFWKSNKSMEGLSAHTVIINAFCQLIIFLYLLDNETSTVVLLSAGVGCAIEFWKITKVMNITIEQRPGRWPRLQISDRGSYVKSKTKQYDAEATRYLCYVIFPLIVGYFVYSLIYDKYTSWYSFVLQSLVGSVYAFGFVLMCPQLYLNYKLKSVAHLPWRQMTYKFLNTIIDDLFAFVIKMPLLHRLSVFRDDIIFLIYLYQRWIYPVDKARVNEFGFSDEAPADALPEGGAGEGAEGEAVGAIDGPAGEGGANAEERAAGNSGVARGKQGKRKAAGKVVAADADAMADASETAKSK